MNNEPVASQEVYQSQQGDPIVRCRTGNEIFHGLHGKRRHVTATRRSGLQSSLCPCGQPLVIVESK